jgi:hypothetical protein
MECVTIKLEINRQQLLDHCGYTPNVSVDYAMRKFLDGALSYYENSYGEVEPTFIDFSIISVEGKSCVTS